jgi:hypothetical protein
MKAWLKTLGEHMIRELIRSQNSNKPEMTILNRFMCEVLQVPNVNVLGPFASADDVFATFNTCIVVFEDWRVALR